MGFQAVRQLSRFRFVRGSLVFSAIAFLTAFAPSGVTLGAEEPKPPAPSKSAAGKNSAVASGESWEKLIYIPYRALKSVLQDPKAAAIVPLDEYLRWLQSNRTGTTRLPIAAVVSEAHYDAKVDKDIVRIHAVLTVQSLEKHWSGATVAFGDAAIGKITSEKDRVLVRRVGTRTLRPTRAGRRNVQGRAGVVDRRPHFARGSQYRLRLSDDRHLDVRPDGFRTGPGGRAGAATGHRKNRFASGADAHPRESGGHAAHHCSLASAHDRAARRRAADGRRQPAHRNDRRRRDPQ